VFGLFITLPYGKFVHGIYRWVALVRYEKERRLILASEAEEPVATSTGQGGTRP
jgi:citrate/tricarballylate utilization protein